MQNNLTKAAIAFLAVATLTAACNSNDEEIQPANTETNTTVQSFSVNIPASMKGNGSISKSLNISTDNSITCGFKTSEKVYVYNKTQEEFLEGTLSPTNISADGLSCVISGNLSGSVNVNDVLEFYYNANNFGNPTIYYNNFNFDKQTGSISNLLDAGVATGIKVVSVNNGNFETDNTPDFRLLQSIFRFKFVDEGNNNEPINVKSLYIMSEYNSVSAFYSPFYPTTSQVYSNDGVSLVPGSSSKDDLYAALCIDENQTGNNDALLFTVADNNGVLYKGEAAAPSGGFKNGNYYYKNTAIALTKFGQLPTFTAISNIDEQYSGLTKDERIIFSVEYDEWKNPCNFKLSGTSEGCMFHCTSTKTTTATIEGLNATYDQENVFILSSWGSLALDIKGNNNSIKCPNYDYCFGTVTLSGNGTLTLTAKKESNKGFYSYTVADGHTVTCSDATANGDGTYSWTYTISPSNN